MSIYSQADSGSSQTCSNISPETGQVSFLFPIISLQSALPRSSKSKRDIVLKYNDNSAVSSVSTYGTGWSIGGVSYISNNQNFYFTDNKCFSKSGLDMSDKVIFKDQKTQDVLVQYYTAENYYKASHIDGVVEKLVAYDSAHKSYFLETLTFVNGEKFIFDYKFTQGDPVLRSIISSTGVELVIFQYTDSNLLENIKLWRGTEYAVCNVTITEPNSNTSLLSKLSSFAELSETVFSYVSFESSSYKVLSSIEYPGSANEQFQRDAGHEYYPEVSTPSRAPRVSRHLYSRAPSTDPIVKEYAYTENNFLGNPNPTWSYESDNLYDTMSPNEYFYSVTETTIASESDSANNLVHKRTYNTFHLLTEEVQTCQGCTMSKVYSYPCDDHPSDDFSEQPNNVLFSTKTMWTLTDGDGNSKEFSTYTTTDDFGNKTSQTRASGIVETYEFYPAEGESEACPADPFNFFTRFLKSTRTESADENLSKGKTFFYESLQPLNSANDLPPYVVKVKKVDLSSNNIVQSSVSVERVSDPSSYHTHNCIKTFTFVNASDDMSTAPTIKCDMDYQYDATSDTMTTTQTISGEDGTSFTQTDSKIATTSLATGGVDRHGCKVSGEYALSGKLLSSSSGVGTDQEQKTSYTYNTSDPDANNLYTVVRTEPNGMKTRISYDHIGNIVKAERAPPTVDSSELTYVEVYAQSFDEFGRQNLEYVSDPYVDGDEQSTYGTVVTSKEYDAWHQVCKRVRTREGQPGLTEMITNDAVGMKKTSQMQFTDPSTQTTSFLAAKTTVSSQYRSPSSIVDTKDDGSTISTTFSYDGLGRKIGMTSPLGNETVIEAYDIFDRPTRVRRADNAVIEITYSSCSPTSLVGDLYITADDLTGSVGTQAFDGISRKTSRTVAGCTTEFSYTNGSSNPNTITTAAGNTISIVYMNGLTSVPESITAWDGVQGTESDAADHATFTYGTDALGSFNLGKVIEAGNSERTCEWKYSSSGNVTHNTCSETADSNQVDWSGKATTYGKQISFNYTPSISQESISHDSQFDNDAYLTQYGQSEYCTVNLSYDGFGRLEQETVLDPDTSVLLQKSKISMDSFNREAARTITTYTSDGLAAQILSLSYEYDDENRMTRKIVTENNISKVVENYSYDKLDRLILYQVDTGFDFDFLPSPTKDNDLKMTEQSMVYDSLSNILSVQTTLVDSGGNSYDDDAQWNYDDAFKCRPTSISHTLTSHFPATTSFEYGPDGNMISMTSSSKGTVSMKYSVAGRLLSYTDENGTTETFAYDALQRLAKNGKFVKIYNNSDICGEYGTAGEDEVIDYTRTDWRTFAECSNINQKRIIGSGRGNDALISSVNGAPSYQAYTPFGASGNLQSRTGYRGMVRTAGAGLYMPGEGTRLYLPEFGLFTSMDTMSPFGGGGLNPYIYCKGNPLNQYDPTGHWSTGVDLGMNILCFFIDVALLTAATVALGPVGSAGAMELLGVVSCAFGVVSDTLGIAADSMAIQDDKQGTDRSDVVTNLGFASSIFAVASLATGIAETAGKSSARGVEKGLKNSANVVANGTEDGVTCLALKFTEPASDGSLASGLQLKQGGVTQALGVTNHCYTRTVAGEFVISSLSGVDFEAIEKIFASGMKSGTVLSEGLPLAANMFGTAIGYGLMANGTWNVSGTTSSSAQNSEAVIDQIEALAKSETVDRDEVRRMVQNILTQKLQYS